MKLAFLSQLLFALTADSFRLSFENRSTTASCSRTSRYYHQSIGFPFSLTVPTRNTPTVSTTTAARSKVILYSEGPRASSERRRHRTTTQRTTRREKSTEYTHTNNPTTRSRAPHQFDHTQADARPFLSQVAGIVQQQDPNLNAPVYKLRHKKDSSTASSSFVLSPAESSHFESLGLDELFPELGDSLNFSHLFCTTDLSVRMREAIRVDVFHTTPTYANLSEKARNMLLLPDSSLQGSWQCRTGEGERMKELTKVLSEYLGEQAPTGDEFMNKIGGLCGETSLNHWIDIVGVKNRKITHSWHQDTGNSSGGRKTVLLGFPQEPHFEGVGVFSHLVKLETPAEVERSGEVHLDEPIVYTDETIADEYIVRPVFRQGCEIIRYRDVDVLHSAPDVTYRASLMRFM